MASTLEISQSGLAVSFDCDQSIQAKMPKSPRLHKPHGATTDRVAFEGYGWNDLAAKEIIMIDKHESRPPSLVEFAYHIHFSPPRINRNRGFDMPDRLLPSSECSCRFLHPMSWEVE